MPTPQFAGHTRAHFHGTVNHVVANDLIALQECLTELTRLGIPVLHTYTGGTQPRVLVPNCLAVRKLRGTHVGQGHGQDGHFHRFTATVCLCDVEWRVPA